MGAFRKNHIELESKPNDRRPFNQNFSDYSDNSFFLSLIEGNPNKIIRVLKPEEGIIKGGVIDYALVGKQLLKELENKYKIKVAPTDILVAKDDFGYDAVCSITEQIEGVNLWGIEQIKSSVSAEEEKNIIGQLDKHYLSLLKYFIDIYNKDGYIFWDNYKDGQFVYGHRHNETAEENQIYLVDTDILFDKMKNQPGIENNFIITLTQFVEHHERVWGQEFHDFREYISHLASSRSINNNLMNVLKTAKNILDLT